MSRCPGEWISNPKVKLVFNASEIWRDRCLLENGSVFSDDKKLWTKENFKVHLKQHFIKKLKIEDFDVSEGKFFGRLKEQLELAPSEVKQLVAEIFWMMMLVPTDRTYETKRKNIEKIWNWSEEGFPTEEKLKEKDLIECLEQGVALLGEVMLSYYFHGLYYSIIWLQHWKSKSPSKQRELINDYQVFAQDLQDWENEHHEEVLQNTREQVDRGINIRNTSMRQIILYLLFPDYFEKTATKQHKKKIIAFFRKEKGNWSRSNWDDDKLLLEIRQEEEKRRRSKGLNKDFDFYDAVYQDQWNPGWRPPGPPGKPGKTPLNQILYGPPGTGKTYATRRMAVEIIDGANKLTDEEIKKRYKELEYDEDEDKNKDGKIWFVTFHQSYGYEDFVEGIKPILEEGKITYDVKSSIFKEICDEARSFKDDKFKDVIEELKEKCGEEYQDSLRLQTPTEKSLFSIKHISTGNFRIRTRDGKGVELSVPVESLKALHRQGKRPTFCRPYIEGVYQYMREKMGLNPYPKDASPEGKYVLIIDEINRGNISKILGELITLLEEDKREGNDEELRVTLPYSQEKFSVPNNIYIIGTMNTADRSIAFLDMALRRRFEFTKIMPDYKVLEEQIGSIENIDIAKMLKAINIRITKNLDRDHQIGHAHFWALKGLKEGEDNAFEKLQAIFKGKILPLIEEYFFEQDDKIRKIIGDDFFDKDSRLLEGNLLEKKLQDPQTYQNLYKDQEKSDQ